MIKNFLDADEERIEPKTSSAESSIFGGLSEEPVVRLRADDYHDPFAASDFRIEPEPTVAAASERRESMMQEPLAYTPPTAEQSSRMSGLAFTAGIAFVSSVAFMLVLGWLVDTFIGTGPWGIVGGIVLGSIIGFIQFFRLNSQILKNSNSHQPSTFLDLGEKKAANENISEPAVSEPDPKDPENNPTAL